MFERARLHNRSPDHSRSPPHSTLGAGKWTGSSGAKIYKSYKARKSKTHRKHSKSSSPRGRRADDSAAFASHLQSSCAVFSRFECRPHTRRTPLLAIARARALTRGSMCKHGSRAKMRVLWQLHVCCSLSSRRRPRAARCSPLIGWQLLTPRQLRREAV